MNFRLRVNPLSFCHFGRLVMNEVKGLPNLNQKGSSCAQGGVLLNRQVKILRKIG